MMNEITYKIGSGVVEKYEAEVLAGLEELYSDEGERMVVETVLIPQFRAALAAVFEEFVLAKGLVEGQVLAPKEIPELCVAVDRMIEANRELLDVDGLFEPVMERISEVRGQVGEELKGVFYEICREILTEKGIIDRRELLRKGYKFSKLDFGEYGKAISFVGKILGRTVNPITLSALSEIADVLELPELSDENKGKYRDALANHGIIDRRSLLRLGPTKFNKLNFGEYGRGASFAGKILGRTVNPLTLSALNEIADVLELPDISEERKAKYRHALANHGVIDRRSLMKIGSQEFKKLEFGAYGKGGAFVSNVLGRQLQVTLSNLSLMADILFGKENDEGKKEVYLSAFAKHGITDRRGLLDMGVVGYMNIDFGDHGKGTRFAGKVLGRFVDSVTLSVLNEIADVLKLPNLSEENKEKYRKALAHHGVSNRNSLMVVGTKRFAMLDFGEFGNGRRLMKGALCRVINNINLADLKEMADILFGKDTEEERRKGYLKALSSHGIVDRGSLLKVGSERFIQLNFREYGKGTGFAGKILGRSVRRGFTLSDLNEIADVLDLPELSEESKGTYRDALANHGIIDRRSLLDVVVSKFRYLEFEEYGKGKGFIGMVLCRRVGFIKFSDLEELADVLFPEKSDNPNTDD